MAMSGRNERQYRLMLERLNGFEQGRIRLDILVTDLEALLNVLEDVPPSWRQTFLHDWGILEDIKAVALDRGARTFDQATTEILLAAVGRLKLMVLEEIDDPADHPQDMDWTRDQ